MPSNLCGILFLMEAGGDAPLGIAERRWVLGRSCLALHRMLMWHWGWRRPSSAHLTPLPHCHHSQKKMEVPSRETNIGLSISGITPVP